MTLSCHGCRRRRAVMDAAVMEAVMEAVVMGYVSDAVMDDIADVLLVDAVMA